MQLVAYGAQDIYLTGNPQITFFKVVYRRHTNFSMEAIEQTWNGTSITSDARCTATISRNGDLVYRMYLELYASGLKGKVSNPSSVFITDVELEIGGQKIDKQTGHWMETWAELTESNPTGETTDQTTIATGTLFQRMSGMGGCAVHSATNQDRLFIPLQFWFCRNPGLALPLIALQYHEVKVILNHKASTTTTWQTAPTDNKLWCDYIYLDTDERRRFAQVSHEYLIEQVQEMTSGTEKNIELNFNHPVKELIWTGDWKPGYSISTTPSGASTYQLKLNGHDRFAARDYRYFTRTQVWQHHSGSGGLGAVASDAAVPTAGGSGSFNDSIGVYSFALKPEEHQPSGTCNFSRIDNAQLVIGSSGAIHTIFAVNYNVLRIMSGMGGLAYSN